MNKIQLITAVNDQLTAIITQAKVRLASLSIINSLFPAEVLQEITTGFITCKLYYKKIGNECRVTGIITNNLPYMISSTNLVTIPSSLFFAKNLNDTQDIITNESTYSIGVVKITNDQIYLIGNLGGGSRVRINASYQTND